ncbi:hypothetical protein EPH_0005050 [Eimeria praecox]|uniref:Uncharacterized protein n=1 Tax=Eimeria praecox TaxID=51316 RepID=U6G9R7_9EIME|nr:hypothetical protein EPH_0005050 [Eimeria praecox]
MQDSHNSPVPIPGLAGVKAPKTVSNQKHRIMPPTAGRRATGGDNFYELQPRSGGNIANQCPKMPVATLTLLYILRFLPEAQHALLSLADESLLPFGKWGRGDAVRNV